MIWNVTHLLVMMALMLILLGELTIAPILNPVPAQVLQDPAGLVGNSGWTGVGLLGAILAWLLFFHLPAKDKQLKEFMDTKDLHVEKMAIKFQEALDSVILHCREEMKYFREALDQEVTNHNNPPPMR